MAYETNRKALRPTVFILLAACISLWAADVQAAATVSGQTLVSSVRTGRTIFDYTYTLTLTNAQPALNSATVQVTSRVASTVVLKSSVSVPAIAAGATITTTDTFVIQQDRTVPFSWSNVTFTVVPGPGSVAQGTINSATGGTIVVNDPGDPLFGTTITIPPGALGDPTDTITIGYDSQLPAPFPASAISHGIVQASPVLTLSKAGPTPLQSVVTVTIPYSTSGLHATDVPAVVFWDQNSNEFQSVTVPSFDSVNGFVTFATIHFSKYVTAVEAGLVDRLTNPQALPPPPQDNHFRPSTDGFEAQNFATGFNGRGYGDSGVCFAAAAYALWYYDDTQLGAHFNPVPPPLFAALQTPSDAELQSSVSLHVPQEDSVAREIMAWMYLDSGQSDVESLSNAASPGPFVGFINSLFGNTYPAGLALDQAALLVTNLDFGFPQMLDAKSSAGTAGGHTFVVYKYAVNTNAPTPLWLFSVYDPNSPGVDNATPVVWVPANAATNGWNVWQGEYDTFYFDTYSDYYDPNRLVAMTANFLSPQPGPLPPTKTSYFKDGIVQFPGGWFFNTLSISSPLGQSGANTYPAIWPDLTGTASNNPSTLYVDPVNGTTLTFAWNCPTCLPSGFVKSDGTVVNYYLHVYQDDLPLDVVEIPSTSGATSGQATVMTEAFTAGQSSNELFALVSDQSVAPTSPDTTGDQSDVCCVYAGFQRVKIAQQSVQISVATTPGFIGLPATISLSGFFQSSILSFEQNGDQNGNCLTSANTGERGFPLFSGTVDKTATFTGANNDTATPLGSTTMEPFPYTFNGPYPSYYPCSSFVAYDKPDANGNGKVWINAVGRGEGFNANSGNTDWEYQVRYYSGDPAKQYSDASCMIGTVPDDDAFSGEPVACTVKCNTGLFGKLPSCTQ